MSSFLKMFRGESRRQRGTLWRVIKPTRHGSRHRSAQMKYFSGAKFRRQATNASRNATWRYARNNVLSR